MSGSRLLCVFSALILLPKGQSNVIQTTQTVTATVGGDVHFCCQLQQTKDVRQVTWQKLSPAGEKNLASSDKFFGQRVNAEFTGKVAFEDTSLQNSSIVLRRVELQDEGCFRCLFSIYPDGVFAGRTCLQLQELHEPLLQVSSPDSGGLHWVVQCWATGRPAPTVTLSVSQPSLLLSNHTSVTESNSNGTDTVYVLALLRGSPLHGAEVGCAVRQQSGAPLNTFVTFPEVVQMPRDEPTQIVWLWAVLPALLLICIIGGVFLRRSKKNRDSQRTNTPQKEAQHLTGPQQTPARQLATEELRRRTPRPPQKRFKGFFSVSRKLFETVDS
ncbi:unnamed protein product [Ophioblennius macclurei]